MTASAEPLTHDILQKENEADLHKLAGALIDYETLTNAEIDQVPI